MLMSRNGSQRIAMAQGSRQRYQCIVLLRHKWNIIRSLDFNSDGKIIASFASAIFGNTCMPCPFVGGDKLYQHTVPPDQKMRGDFQRTQLVKKRMTITIKTIQEKIRNIMTAEFTRRQTDIVNDQQINCLAFWTVILIR